MTRFARVMFMSCAAIGVAACLLPQSSTLFIWNASASVPIGLYRVTSERRVSVAELVVVMPPAPVTDFMVEHGYIGRGVLLLKRVAALPGQQVCRIGSAVTVDGTPLGDALDRDRRGRQLPVWQGCRRIADGELFLMNSGVGDSFDGRYFGPVSEQSIIGRATPIYTDENSNGRFVLARSGTRLPTNRPEPHASTFSHTTHKEASMPQIGTFSRDTTGFVGRIHTFTLNRDIIIVRIEPSDVENTPDYRIYQGEDGPAIGVGWNRTGERAGEYVALLIDDPMLPQLLRATLFRNDDSGATWSLHWSRRHKRNGGS